MSNPKWKVGPVKLANGWDATIYRYCEIRKRYIGEVKVNGGWFRAAEWHIGGSYFIAGTGDPMLDLVPPPKKTVRVNVWLNVDACGSVGLFQNREDADMLSSVNRFACIEIDREVEEGEGLDPNVRSDAANMRRGSDGR